MKRTKFIAFGLLAGLSLFGSCTQNVGSYKIVDTNQSKCFDDRMEITAPNVGDVFYGQDAQHAGNAPSYTNNGDGTVTDNVTGLMWQKAYKVMSYPEALKTIETFRYAGYNDWRIPSIKEAYSLILFSGTDVSSESTTGGRTTGTPFVDLDYFDFEYAANGERPIDSQMLSSSLYAGSTEEEQLIFGVNFADGRIKGYGTGLHGQDKQFVVRFVRGDEYGINDFVDNGDGTVSDKATSLMWSQDDSCEAMNWQEALAYAQEMNSRNYRGHSDWRLPNAKELQSIVDYNRSPLSTSSAAIDPIFNTTTITNEAGAEDYPFYWTSTTHENSGSETGGAAVYVAFGRSLGNMSSMQGMGGGMPGMSRQGQGGQRQGQNQGQERPQMANGERPQMGGNGERPQMGNGERQERGNGERPQMGGNRERPQMGSGERQERGNGERPQMGGNGERPQMGNGERQDRGNGERPQMGENGERPQMGENGERPQRGNGERPQMGENGERPQMGNRQQGGLGGQRPGGTSAINWTDVHGAGSQRSDPKAGDASIYASGHGPQGDVIRINNYVRLVRDL
ncbi:MAG: DUF1566 domain-containing protein [Rikenellaceae bacterium]